jgi:hypothetical protein
VERLRKSNGCGRWVAILQKLLTMSPETRSAGRRVTRSSTAGALAKKRDIVESVAVAKMPPKGKRKKPVKVAKKRRLAKRKRVASVDEGKENKKEWECAECGALGWYGRRCYYCDDGSLCVILVGESLPSEYYSSG